MGGDIAKQMPVEAKKFAKIDKDWAKSMLKGACMHPHRYYYYCYYYYHHYYYYYYYCIYCVSTLHYNECFSSSIKVDLLQNIP